MGRDGPSREDDRPPDLSRNSRPLTEHESLVHCSEQLATSLRQSNSSHNTLLFKMSNIITFESLELTSDSFPCGFPYEYILVNVSLFEF
jgi:hypothetical protein